MTLFCNLKPIVEFQVLIQYQKNMETRTSGINKLTTYTENLAITNPKTEPNKVNTLILVYYFVFAVNVLTLI